MIEYKSNLTIRQVKYHFFSFFMLNFYKRLKKIRLEIGLSQEEFAKRLNTTQSNYSKYELGKVHPAYTFLQELTDKLDVNIHWLLTGQGEMFLPGQPPQPGQYNPPAPGQPATVIMEEIQKYGEPNKEEALKKVLTAFNQELQRLQERVKTLEAEVERLKKLLEEPR